MKRLKNLIVCMLVIVMAVVFTLPVTFVEAEAASALKKTKVTSFKSPSAGKAAVTYAKVKGAKYQIQVATNSKMSKGKKSYKTSATTKVMSLKKGKKYWVRVRTYKKINGKTKYSKCACPFLRDSGYGEEDCNDAETVQRGSDAVAVEWLCGNEV